MESEICVTKRGECSAETVKCSDYLEIVKRNCGDYVEVTPRGTLFNHGGITAFQCAKGRPEERRPKDPNTLRSTFPGIVLKFPKNLPEDMTERVKVLTQIRDEAVLKLARYIIEAHNMASNPHQDIDEVENLCELKSNLNRSMYGGGSELRIHQF